MSKNTTINFAPTEKQHQMFQAFDEDVTTEVLYGGSAGSAKSYGICSIALIKALSHPGIRIGLARNELVTLKKTTVVSLFEVADDWGISDYFTYNSTAGIFKFENGSEIILCELRYLPRDPEYTRLGGLLLTFGLVDELGEVDVKGYNIFKSRLGRWRNTEFKMKPICISTCNPIKNWLYRDWYEPNKEGTLPAHMLFIQALPTDNPYLPESYIQQLSRLPMAQRERLLYGNWDYEDDPNALMNYEETMNIYRTTENVDVSKFSATNRFITADIAFTSDKLVILVWIGYTVVEIVVNPDGGNVEGVLLDLARKWNVPAYNIAYDADGVGKFLEKKLTSSVGIVNNARAMKDENYKNLKTQLFYKLAEMIKENTVKIEISDYYKEILEELQVIRYKPTADVGKLELISKDAMKKILGRSPDFADAMAYRMYFFYKQTKPSFAIKVGTMN